ncbi:MAG: LytTR family transcriptional regulator DNA-binding domain-containing protein [Firmicutes bacterium]|nr:LytTR family transcriptional regulator DNA-binding domain-containing protein [Bacillota bacterium]
MKCDEVVKWRLHFLFFDKGIIMGGIEMKRAIMIVGEENELGMQVLEQQLAQQLKRRSFPQQGEWFFPGREEARVFSFRQKGHERKLSTDWIVYLEKDMRRIFIYLENGVKISFYSGMDEVMKQLGKNFCQCHKSFVINMDKVEKMSETMFYMVNGAEVPIGQRRLGEVRVRYENYRDQKNLEKLRFFESFSCFEM